MRACVAFMLSVWLRTPAIASDWPPLWTTPVAPFRIVGKIYYVGSEGLAAYLITSPVGDILLDGTIADNAPMIERNIAKLGFDIRDVKLLLNTHAHLDHAGALARLKEDSGARLLASGGDRPILETGRLTVENSSDQHDFPAVKVDGLIRDGQVVRLGPIIMTAALTPGHTPGCTSWRTTVEEGGSPLHVVFPCSITTAGNKLIGNRTYPGIVADYRRSFARLSSMQADVVLTAHPELADVLGRSRRRDAGDENAFVDPTLLPKIVKKARSQFETDFARERATGRY